MFILVGCHTYHPYKFTDPKTRKMLNEYHKKDSLQLLKGEVNWKKIRKEELDELKYWKRLKNNDMILFYENRLSKIDSLSRDEYYCSHIEKLIHDIKRFNNDSIAIFYPWEEVALSLIKYPIDVTLNYDDCDKCQNKLIKMNFSSPTWTWVMMCGRAGTLIFCPLCKEQKDFKLEALN